MKKSENDVNRVRPNRISISKAKGKLLKKKLNRLSGKQSPIRQTRITRNRSKQIQPRSSAVNHNSFFESLVDMEADENVDNNIADRTDSNNQTIANEIIDSDSTLSGTINDIESIALDESIDRTGSTNETVQTESIDLASTSSGTSGGTKSNPQNVSIVSISSDTSFAMRLSTDFQRQMMEFMKELLVRMGAVEKNVAKLDVRMANYFKMQLSDRQDTFVNVPIKLDINDLNELQKRCLPVNSLSDLDTLERSLFQ